MCRTMKHVDIPKLLNKKTCDGLWREGAETTSLLQLQQEEQKEQKFSQQEKELFGVRVQGCKAKVRPRGPGCSDYSVR